MTITTESKFNKSQFIRERPNMKPQDIVDEAEKLGQEISLNLIWNTRSKVKKALEAAEIKAVKKAAKKATKKVSVAKAKATVKKKAADPSFNKSQFIRERPNMSASEISAAAEKQGQEISPGMVWSIRSADKKKASGVPAHKAVAKAHSKKVAKKASKKVAKKVAKKASKLTVHKPQSVATFAPRKDAAVSIGRNGHSVTVVVFDPRDPKAVTAATKAMRTAVAHA